MNGVSRMDIHEDVALVSFQRIPLGLEVLSDIFQQFAQKEVNIDMISQTAPTSHHVDICFTCLDDDMVKVLEVSKILSEKYPGMKPMVSNGNCKIRLYGEEMREMSGVFALALGSLREQPVELMQVSTSEVDISLLVDAVHVDAAVAALKDTFSVG